jgi:hypothetical protein
MSCRVLNPFRVKSIFYVMRTRNLKEGFDDYIRLVKTSQITSTEFLSSTERIYFFETRNTTSTRKEQLEAVLNPESSSDF